MKNTRASFLFLFPLVIALTGCGEETPMGTPEALVTALKARDVESAYRLTSKGFQANTPNTVFQEFLNGTGLISATGGQWQEPRQDGMEVVVKGAVSTQTHGTVPVSLTLVFEGGVWRIFRFDASIAGLRITDEQLEALKKVSVDLVRVTVAAFDRSLKEGNFGPLRQIASELFREQFPENKLQQIFAGFVEQKVDLSRLQDINPRFEADPLIDDSGLLVLRGFYPTQPVRLRFDMKFVRAATNWQLVSINMSLK